MKKILLLLLIVVFSTLKTFSQGTYYWVGGINAIATPGAWNTAANWNQTIGGGGTNRTTPNAADILIFDGSNLGGGATWCGIC